LNIDSATEAGNVEFADLAIEQANVRLPRVTSVRASGVRVKKELKLQAKERVARRKSRSLAEKSTEGDIVISNIWLDDSASDKNAVLSVEVLSTKDANGLSISVSNVSNVALQLTASDVTGLSHVELQDISGSSSHLSDILVKNSSLHSLSISRVGFNSGGTVDVTKSKVKEQLAFVGVSKIKSLMVKESESARVQIQEIDSVAGDLIIEGHQLTGSLREFDLDLEDAVVGGNVVIDNISGA